MDALINGSSGLPGCFFRRQEEGKTKKLTATCSQIDGTFRFTLLPIFYFYSNAHRPIPVLDDWKSMCLHFFIFSRGSPRGCMHDVSHHIVKSGLRVSRTGNVFNSHNATLLWDDVFDVVLTENMASVLTSMFKFSSGGRRRLLG